MKRCIRVLQLGAACAALVIAATSAVRADDPPVFITGWGSPGSGPAEMDSPDGIGVDNAGSVYVVDSRNQRIEQFSDLGSFSGSFGDFGAGSGHFDAPIDCAVGQNGLMYVTDGGNALIQVFDSSHNFITQWPAAAFGWAALNASGTLLYVSHSESLFVHQASDGTIVSRWRFSEAGPGANSWGFAVAPSGNVYISGVNQYYVRMFTSDGTLLAQWGGPGTGDGQFAEAEACAIDSHENVYVCDGSGRIEKFTSAGAFLTKWGTPGIGSGQFSVGGLFDIAIDASDNVYVLDHNLDRVQKFGQVATATVRHSWGRLKQLYK